MRKKYEFNINNHKFDGSIDIVNILYSTYSKCSLSYVSGYLICIHILVKIDKNIGKARGP